MLWEKRAPDQLCAIALQTKERLPVHTKVKGMVYLRLLIVASLALMALGVYGKKTKEFPVTKECLTCICEAISGCDRSMKCVPIKKPSHKNGTQACGPFRISWPLWYDAERPTPDGIDPDSDKAFQACTLDYDCSIRTVENYIENHSQDCDGDHKIDCNDYGRIIKMGGYHCDGRPNEMFVADLNMCLTKRKITG